MDRLAWIVSLGIVACSPEAAVNGDSDTSSSNASNDASSSSGDVDASTSADGSDASTSSASTETSTSESSSGDTQPLDTSDSNITTGDDAAAPMILSLTADVLAITENGEVVLTAEVTDPDDDIIGGILSTEDGASEYGPFGTIRDGIYIIELEWDEIHAVEPIEFDAPTSRTFVASFVDGSGLETTATIDLTLTCFDTAACDGECTSLASDEDNCGTCGFVCGGVDACEDGLCVDNCGNGEIDPGEQCDGENLQGFDCFSLGLVGGVLGCEPAICVFDVSGCDG